MACLFDKGERDLRMSMQDSQLLIVVCGISVKRWLLSLWNLNKERGSFYPLVYSLRRVCAYDKFAKYCNYSQAKFRLLQCWPVGSILFMDRHLSGRKWRTLRCLALWCIVYHKLWNSTQIVSVRIARVRPQAVIWI
jgi:hypothetical protein